MLSKKERRLLAAGLNPYQTVRPIAHPPMVTKFRKFPTFQEFKQW